MAGNRIPWKSRLLVFFGSALIGGAATFDVALWLLGMENTVQFLLLLAILFVAVLLGMSIAFSLPSKRHIQRRMDNRED